MTSSDGIVFVNLGLLSSPTGFLWYSPLTPLATVSLKDLLTKTDADESAVAMSCSHCLRGKVSQEGYKDCTVSKGL